MKIGYILVTHEHSSIQRGLRYVELRDLAQQAEELGFDSLWLHDHFLYRTANQPTLGSWECWTLLASLAEATKKIGIGSLVISAAYRNPALVAKMATTLDEVSNGRFILGLGAGWNEAEFRAFGYPSNRLVSRFEEAIQIICPLLRTGNVDFNGIYYEARDCEIVPRGPSANGPQVMIASAGPRMLRLTAQYADLWHAGTQLLVDGLEKLRIEFREACNGGDLDPANIPTTITFTVGFPELGTSPKFHAEHGGHFCGTAEELAGQFAILESHNVDHVMIYGDPPTPDALKRLGLALQIYRSESTGFRTK